MLVILSQTRNRAKGFGGKLQSSSRGHEDDMQD
jgi:hypothetical protein